MAALNHPNVARVYDVIDHPGDLVIAMEFVEGVTLGQWLKSEPPWRAVVEVFVQAGRGLAAAHAVGLIHRDFKPSNVLIDIAGVAKVLDFGVARRSHGSLSSDATPTSMGLHGELDWFDVELTAQGVAVGTPSYMAPEQLEGRIVDARADQYAFCQCLWEALCWERPFVSLPDMQSRADAKALGPPRWPKPPGVPASIGRIVRRGLAVDPNERHASMEVMIGMIGMIGGLLASSRRRRRMGGVGAALGGFGVAGLALGIGWLEEPPEPCTSGASHLQDVWDRPTRERVGRSIRATEVSFADSTWERVSHRLDAHTERWLDAYGLICRRASAAEALTAGALDRSMACLMRGRGKLQAVTEVLSDADPKVVGEAVSMVADLPPPDECLKLRPVDRWGGEPDVPEVREVASLRDRVAVVEALEAAGRYEDAARVGDEVVERAGALDFDPVRAEALLARGSVFNELGRHREAREDLLQSFQTAMAASEPMVAARAAIETAAVVGRAEAQPEAGLKWAKTALTLARRGARVDLEADALNALGSLYYAQGRLTLAEDAFARGLALETATSGDAHPEVARSLNNLGEIARARGRYDEARAHLERALEIYETTLGSEHPDVAGPAVNLGTVFMEQHRHAEAEPWLRDALRIEERVLGPEHIALASTLGNLGNVLRLRGALDEAEAVQRRALKIERRVLGPSHPEVAASMTNLANVLRSQGKLHEAESLLLQALELRETRLGPRALDVGITLSNLGKLWTLVDDPSAHVRAVDAYRRAAIILDEHLEPQHPYHAHVALGLGNALVLVEEPVEAMEVLDRALEVRTLGERPPMELGDVELSLAEATWAAGDPETARDWAQRALAHYRSSERGETDRIRRARRWLSAHSL